MNLPEVIERQLVGKALVSYFKAGKNGLGKEKLLEVANHLIHINEVESITGAEEFLLRADYFKSWVATLQPVKSYSNYPLKVHFNGQLFVSTIDLLLETKDGLNIVMHNPFVGNGKAILKKVREMMGNLLALQKAVKEIFRVDNISVSVHFVLSGTIVSIQV